ncbi:MAG: cation diffusion facilitator family transporter [Candidatus Omnitrophica bacterium]|nr:cation diffusion facilitator family transporter [Candidatus Omnitrophota bacterium]
MTDKHHTLSLQVAGLSICVNFLLAVLQFSMGFSSNSISIITDAVDSLRDILATGVVIISLRLGRKPADKQHPFGHGRIEDVGGLIISLLLILIGLSFLKDSFARFFHPREIKVNTTIVTMMFSFSIIKLFLGIVTQKVSKKVSSEILKADALHHYTDFITTFIVGAGLLLVQKGARYSYVDSLLGLIIAGIITFFAVKMSKEFVDNLIGKTAPEFFYQRVREIASGFNFVEGVHGIEIHSYGKNKMISLHIEMAQSLSLEEAHSVADAIENKIYQEGLGKCLVHMDLKTGASPVEKRQVGKLIKNVMGFSRQIRDFHSIEIITTENSNILNFHLLMDKDSSVEQTHTISHRLSAILKKNFKFSQVNIHCEPYKGGGQNEGRTPGSESK